MSSSAVSTEATPQSASGFVKAIPLIDTLALGSINWALRFRRVDVLPDIRSAPFARISTFYAT